MTKSIKLLVVLFILGIGVFLGGTALQALGAWTAATANPPSDNKDAPINVGSTAQFKSGAIGLGLTALRNASILFDVNGGGMFTNLFTGTLQVSGGTGAGTTGKVLTAVDENGTVGWADAGSIGGGVSTNTGPSATETGTAGMTTINGWSSTPVSLTINMANHKIASGSVHAFVLNINGGYNYYEHIFDFTYYKDTNTMNSIVVQNYGYFNNFTYSYSAGILTISYTPSPYTSAKLQLFANKW